MKFTISYNINAKKAHVVHVVHITHNRERALQIAQEVQSTGNVVLRRGNRLLLSKQFFNNVIRPHVASPSPTYAHSVHYVR